MRHHVPYQSRQDVNRLNRLRRIYVRSADRPERLTATTDFRRMLYDRGLRVRPDPNESRIRDTSPEFFRQNPAMAHRLIPWLHRELGVLLRKEIKDCNFFLYTVMYIRFCFFVCRRSTSTNSIRR